MSSEIRDARRWASYERLAVDPSASPSERTQAAERLAELRARYPGGRPGAPSRWSAGPRSYAHASWAEGWAPRAREPDPAEQQARAAEARLRRSKLVAWQRDSVERVPNWRMSRVLRDLHENDDVWGEEEHQSFKEQRVRLTGSSRASDL